MSCNIEVKIKIDDMNGLKKSILAMGAEESGQMHQIDTFFGGVNRLKLREYGDQATAELIAYQRPDIADLRTCEYRLCRVSNPDELKETLAFALPLLKTIEKTRLLFLRGRTRIHLDEVKSLGQFLELEVVLGSEDTTDSGEEEALAILKKLGLEDAPRISGSYFDLVDGSDLNEHQ
ncbi:MAG TPA: class IV adenylate cyclase [Candidatus Melainabacteria bacterium]|nr:class IV adenylate cyclase [Candidatus Melainabacteria bacterium]HMP51251.1 class IV adenylate cyclase [Candidatus Melainabacteria bacterium]